MEAIERGDVCWCWPVRYGLMVDARGSEGIAAVERMLENLREVPVDRSMQRAVLTTMRELAAEGSHGAHRFPLTDLTVAAAAQDAGIEILHFDQHLERLGDHLGIRSHWISDPS
jgi:predicted nucleic acid-binding protein